MIDKKYKEKEISFLLSIGHSEELMEDTRGRTVTVPIEPVFDEYKYYMYMPYSQKKPCLSVFSHWPDARIRLFRMNTLSKIYDDLVSVCLF